MRTKIVVEPKNRIVISQFFIHIMMIRLLLIFVFVSLFFVVAPVDPVVDSVGRRRFAPFKSRTLIVDGWVRCRYFCDATSTVVWKRSA